MTTSTGRPPSDKGGTQGILRQDNIAMTVNAFLMADKSAAGGNEQSRKDRQDKLVFLQNNFWRLFHSILSSGLSRRRQHLEFAEDERLFMDLGLLDARMLGGDQAQTARELAEEAGRKGMAGCYYLTEWLANRHQQLLLEYSLDGNQEPDDSFASQLMETRRRVLSRLAEYFTGLPGIPLEVSETMRSGDLDNAIVASGLNAIREPRRKNFLRRHNLWQLREQILTKARARASGQNVLRLFEMLNEIYARDWRGRYENYVNEQEEEREQRPLPPKAGAGAQESAGGTVSVSVTSANGDMLMSEARQIRMRMALMGAVDGKDRPDPVLSSRSPRITKKTLAEFLPLAQTFDRALAELPPILIVPGSGRGFFAWETGCIMVALRPIVGADDSIATALAWYRMLDDRFNRSGVLRAAYEKKFPGAVFQNDFPADYRSWLTRLPKGEDNAMNPERRVFFRDHVGPDISGPILPPNLRNIGPQTMVAICRRLEKQLASGDNDVNLHRRLAALYWQQGNGEAAGLQFNAAMRQAPNDGETLFAAGMFMRAQGDGEAANGCFRFGAERARDSLWGIYCQDALANLV